MKKFLPAIAGLVVYKLLGLGGALAVIYCLWLFSWSESHPRWRWPSLAATFLVGVGACFASLVYFELINVDLETASTAAADNLLAFTILIFSITLVAGSLLMAPVYAYVSALPRMRRKGIVQDVQPADPGTPAPGPDLAERQPQVATTTLPSSSGQIP